jgi:hypothetical protein
MQVKETFSTTFYQPKELWLESAGLLRRQGSLLSANLDR